MEAVKYKEILSLIHHTQRYFNAWDNGEEAFLGVYSYDYNRYNSRLSFQLFLYITFYAVQHVTSKFKIYSASF